MKKKSPFRRSSLFATFLALLVLSLFSTQCASYILCSQYYNVIESRRGTCAGGGGDKQEKINTCQENLSKCSDEDREKVNNTIKCIEKMDKCKGDLSAVAWGIELTSCYTRLAGISGVCQAAFIGGK